MGDSQPSNVVYEGDILITEFDDERLDELNEILQDITDVDEGETLVVSLDSNDQLTVRKLREK